MPSDYIIRAVDLSKRYAFDNTHQWSLFGRRSDVNSDGEGYQALHSMSFSVKRGEAVGVIGRNGAGKSTLLQILTGTLRPTTGSVDVRGRVSALLELGAGFNPEFTGSENVFLTGALVGMTRSEMAEKYHSIIEFADIGDFVNRPVKTYSSGMLVRLAFSTQIHVDPDILVIDEALSVGDIFFQQKCLAKIKQLLDRGVTLLFVSHGLNSVKSLCSRAIYLDRGELKADGPSDEVCDLYQNSLTSHSLIDLEQAVESANALSSDGIMSVEPDASGFEADSGFHARLTQRSGSGSLQFTAFGLFDANGNSVISIEQAARVRVRARMFASTDIPAGAAIGILVRDVNGVDLIAYNSNFYQLRLPSLKAGKSYIWEMEVNLPLAKGQYSWHCGIKPDVSSPYFYDRCFGAAVLDVLGNPVSWGDYGGRIIDKPARMRLSEVGEVG